jgi:hypothetical protein
LCVNLTGKSAAGDHAPQNSRSGEMSTTRKVEGSGTMKHYTAACMNGYRSRTMDPAKVAQMVNVSNDN